MKKGFTIVEMMVFMGILSLFIIVLTDIFSSVLQVHTETEKISSVEQDGKFILAKFMHDTAASSDITVPNVLGTPSNTLQISIDGINYLYSLNGTDLILQNDKGLNKLNSQDTLISNLEFRLLGNPAGKKNIKVFFTVTSVASSKSGQEVKNFETTLGLR